MRRVFFQDQKIRIRKISIRDIINSIKFYFTIDPITIRED